jgi:hypothetical protein
MLIDGLEYHLNEKSFNNLGSSEFPYFNPNYKTNWNDKSFFWRCARKNEHIRFKYNALHNRVNSNATTYLHAFWT